MEEVTFISAIPYLTLSLRGVLSKAVQFVEHKYITSDPQELTALREYADTHKLFVAVQGEGVDLDELIRRYAEAEEQMILKAKEREKARAERERQKKEEHDFYSVLRMSDHAYL